MPADVVLAALEMAARALHRKALMPTDFVMPGLQTALQGARVLRRNV